MKPAVIITGAGSGIGEATTELFSQKGHDVVLVGRNKDKLSNVAKKLKTKTLELSADLRRGPDCDFVIHEAIKVFPHIGILINNAGIYEDGNLLELNDENWYKILETNLLGPVRLTRTLLPHFLKSKSGMVVNVASTAGLRPLPGMTSYSTSKAALIHLTQSLALEYAGQGIKFNVVCPGLVDTPIHGKDRPEVAAMHDFQPLGVVGKPIDIAKSIYYLAMESDWMTGVVLPVDGGISLK